MVRVLVAMVLVAAACSSTPDRAEVSVPTLATRAPATSTTSTSTLASTASSTMLPGSEGPNPSLSHWYLVSATAAVPDGLAEGLETISGVEAVSTVRVGLVHLVESRTAEGQFVDQAPAGFVIPLEAQAFDPARHGEFVPAEVARLLEDLDGDEALLSESSAEFRRLGPGSTLVLEDDTVLTVVGIVDDEWIGAAEVALTREAGERMGVTNERYSVVRYNGPRQDLERDADALEDASVRVRSRDEVDVFRHADAVASQIAIKARFGEFAYRPAEGDVIEIDPAWMQANIVTNEIPLLGRVTCHTDFLALLRDAMDTLEEAGHADAVDPAAFRGCFNPRFIRNRGDISRHAWGVAADINFGNPLEGPGSPTDAALLEATMAIDILSGHTWTDPGPGHFEWFGPAGR